MLEAYRPSTPVTWQTVDQDTWSLISKTLRIVAGSFVIRAYPLGMLDLIGGFYQLARLAVISRFKLRGKYWTWRNHTAFGAGYPLHRIDLIKAVIEYGIWVHKMRK